MSHADIYSGLHATIAVLAALHQRQGTGSGQHIDVAMAAVSVAVNERLHADLADEHLNGEPPALGATDTPFFRTSDGHIVTTAASLVASLTFRLYVQAMRRPDLLDDQRFATPSARVANLAELHAVVQRWVRSFPTRAALAAQLDEAKIAIGTVRTISELATTEWAHSWGAVQSVDDRSGGVYSIPGPPWKFSAAPLGGPGLPAHYGEHNHEVLHEIGYTDADIAALIADGALPDPAIDPRPSTPPFAEDQEEHHGRAN